MIVVTVSSHGVRIAGHARVGKRQSTAVCCLVSALTLALSEQYKSEWHDGAFCCSKYARRPRQHDQMPVAVLALRELARQYPRNIRMRDI